MLLKWLVLFRRLLPVLSLGHALVLRQILLWLVALLVILVKILIVLRAVVNFVIVVPVSVSVINMLVVHFLFVIVVILVSADWSRVVSQFLLRFALEVVVRVWFFFNDLRTLFDRLSPLRLMRRSLLELLLRHVLGSHFVID